MVKCHDEKRFVSLSDVIHSYMYNVVVLLGLFDRVLPIVCHVTI